MAPSMLRPGCPAHCTVHGVIPPPGPGRACQNSRMSPILQPALLARILLLLVIAAGVYFFRGFLVPVLAALIISFASWPLYERLVRACRGRTALAASIALVAVTVGLVVPLSLALHFALQEATTFVRWLLGPRP